MDSFAHQVAERLVDQSLALDPVAACKRLGLDLQPEVAFAAPIMAGVADMTVALVDQVEPGGGERALKAADHFGGDGADCGVAGSLGHRDYIGAMGRKAYDGRVEEAAAECAAPGCSAPGEYRAPLTPGNFDGPGAYRLMCLECIREHNAGYDFFAGMSAEEILAAQSPIPEFSRRVRHFAFTQGSDPGPAWQDFSDPLDAIAARFRDSGSAREARASARFSASEQQALMVLGLKTDTDLHKVRGRYSELVRRYHPDRNGGDRSHEARLTRVIEAWQTLRKAKAFA